MAILGPQDLMGDLSLFDPTPRTARATALTDVDAVAVDVEALRAWILGQPEIVHRVLRMLARQARRTEEALSDLTCIDVGSRTAKHLLRLAQRFGVQDDDAIRLTPHLTQVELAELVGTSRETVNKVLAEFIRQGWIRLQGPEVVIVDSESLNRRARRASDPADVAGPHATVGALPGETLTETTKVTVIGP
jgi:CRP-like cAMP-binding protein